jgi:hypothetical protein
MRSAKQVPGSARFRLGRGQHPWLSSVNLSLNKAIRLKRLAVEMIMLMLRFRDAQRAAGGPSFEVLS